MEVIYKETKDFSESELKELFESVNWESAKIGAGYEKLFACDFCLG